MHDIIFSMSNESIKKKKCMSLKRFTNERKNEGKGGTASNTGGNNSKQANRNKNGPRKRIQWAEE